MHHDDLDEQGVENRAAALAAQLRPGDVLFLQGGLGAGKTVFARALIRALCADPLLPVPSPTFTLVQTYDTAHGPLWHFDLYRLKDPDEIYEIGWEDALSEGLMVVEWPERLGMQEEGGLAPADRLEIVLDLHPDNPARRRLQFIPHGGWKDRI